MIAQATHLVACLGRDVGEERLVARDHRVGEHEVLPDQNPEFVGQVVESVGLVNPSPPHAQHVHVGVGRRLEQPSVAQSVGPGREVIGGDVVRSLHEDRHAVDLDVEALTDRIGLRDHLDGTQSDAPVGRVLPACG